MSDSDFGVEWLLRPADLSTFLSEHWEKRPLTLFRGDEGYFNRLLSLADVDGLLSSHNLRYPAVHLVKDGNLVPQSQYTTEIDSKGMRVGGVIDLVKLFAEYQQGATIILEHLHRSWPPLARLCASVERFLGHPTQTNIYLTPPGSQGFDPHYDTHDVFIIQTAGSKRWRLYGSPLQLPLKSQPCPHPGPDPGQATAEFVLRAGDLIYIPRGFVHEAETSDSVSLHVTLGVITYTWADLFAESIDAVFHRDVRFREALPIGFAWDSTAAARMRAAGAELIQALTGGALPLQETADAIADRFLMSRLPLLDGHLTGVTDAPRLTPRSRVAKRAWLCRLTAEGETVRLHYHGKSLTFPRYLEPTLRFMLETASFPVAAIPGQLNDDGKVGLVRRLIEEGFLRAAEV